MNVIVNKYNIKMPDVYKVSIHTKGNQPWAYVIAAATEQEAAKIGLARFITDDRKELAHFFFNDVSADKFMEKRLLFIQKNIEYISVKKILVPEKFIPVEASSKIQDIYTYEVRYGEDNKE